MLIHLKRFFLSLISSCLWLLQTRLLVVYKNTMIYSLAVLQSAGQWQALYATSSFCIHAIPVLNSYLMLVYKKLYWSISYTIIIRTPTNIPLPVHHFHTITCDKELDNSHEILSLCFKLIVSYCVWANMVSDREVLIEYKLSAFQSSSIFLL